MDVSEAEGITLTMFFVVKLWLEGIAEETDQMVWRGHITHAGNAHLRSQLVESAWCYRYPAKVGRQLQRRQAASPPDTLARHPIRQQTPAERAHRPAGQCQPGEPARFHGVYPAGFL